MKALTLALLVALSLTLRIGHQQSWSFYDPSTINQIERGYDYQIRQNNPNLTYAKLVNFGLLQANGTIYEYTYEVVEDGVKNYYVAYVQEDLSGNAQVLNVTQGSPRWSNGAAVRTVDSTATYANYGG